MKAAYVGDGFYAVPVATDSGVACSICRKKATLGYLHAHRGLGKCYCDEHVPDELATHALPADFGPRLQALREKAELSRAALAAAVGLSAESIRLFETGGRRPTWDTVQALATHFGVTTDTFRDR
jgi:DNA-binding XRE family transcriptional regulator